MCTLIRYIKGISEYKPKKPPQKGGFLLQSGHMQYKTHSLSEFQDTARDLLGELLAIPAEQAVVVGLVGDLGAGKTTLVQEWAKVLGFAGKVTSPTFTLVQRYPTNQDRFPELLHADLYRLESERELRTIGALEWGTDPRQLLVIEWPYQVSGVREKLTHIITITENKTGVRTIQSELVND